MGFSVLPPEINSARMYTGAGSGPMLATAAAWDGLAGELGAAAASFSSLTSGLANGSWQGAAAQAMANAAAPYAGWLHQAATRAETTASQAKAAAAVFEAAQAATVHPLQVVANRTQLMSLVNTNLLGLNAPAIAAVESEYEQMWAQDVAAMSSYYGGASAVTAQLTSWQQALQNLPGLAGNGANAAADPLSTLGPTLGIGNSNPLNLGIGNTGVLNLGNGNTGLLNLGSGNMGAFNFGDGNNGPSTAYGFASELNVGIGNIGMLNVGFGNAGVLNIGFGNGNAYTLGTGQPSGGNVGGGNVGDF